MCDSSILPLMSLRSQCGLIQDRKRNNCTCMLKIKLLKIRSHAVSSRTGNGILEHSHGKYWICVRVRAHVCNDRNYAISRQHICTCTRYVHMHTLRAQERDSFSTRSIRPLRKPKGHTYTHDIYTITWIITSKNMHARFDILFTCTREKDLL